jgi:hypothetical protein
MSKLTLLTTALTTAQMTRRQLILFTLISAVLNGLVTASIGAWLAQTYARAQQRQDAIKQMSNLVYERRTRAGMVVSSMRRLADTEELKHRKRLYDEVYVDWNKNVRLNLFVIREVMGEKALSAFEQDFEELLIHPMSLIDNCLTKAYDLKLAGTDPLPVLDACQMPMLHQLVLDCGATFTNEVYKLTRMSFLPTFLPSWRTTDDDRTAARARIKKGCTRPALP